MNDQVNITSNDQQGGITAQNINIAKPNVTKKSSIWKIIRVTSGIIAFIAALVTILGYMGIKLF